MIHFHVDMQDLTEIEAALGMVKDKSTMVLRSAINDTAKQIEKRMSRDAKSKYKYKSGRVADIRAFNKIKKATAGNMTAMIESVGTANDLLDFVVKPSDYFPGGKGAPTWIKARGKRNGRFTRLARNPSAAGDKYKGFVVKFDSGHLAVVERVPGKYMRQKHVNRKYGGQKKEALEALYSIATPKMEEVVYRDNIADDMYDILQENIQKQMLRYLG